MAQSASEVRNANGETVMIGVHPLHWLFHPLAWIPRIILVVVVILIVYWIIRLAVRHGNRDSRDS